MKKQILLLILFLLFTSCKEYKFSQLIIKIEYDEKTSDNLPLSQLSVYKDGKLYKKIVNNEALFFENPIKLDSIEKGNYVFEYYNLFGEKTREQIKIENKKETDTITIFPDRFDYEKYLNKSIIKNLKNNSVVIKYNSQGCYHKISDSIKITNINGKYFILYKNFEKQINKRQLDNLIKFESQLYAIPSDGECTTIETYTIIFDYKINDIKNGSCVWSGWSNLKDEILNIK